MTTWRSSRLAEHHDAGSFDCGQGSLERWLAEQALRAERAGVSATTAWTPPDQQRVVAFYSITPTVLRRAELPSRSMTGGYSTIPGYLLGRLALDRTLHGQGLGSQLLIDALKRILSASDRGGGRIIAVDAVDATAAAFYEHHNFRPIPETDRLVMKIATARAAITP